MRITQDMRKSFSKGTREAVYAKTDGHCIYCGCKLAMKDMQVDHVFPFISGGKNDLVNLVPSCRMCNFRKGDYIPQEFKRLCVLACQNTIKRFYAARFAEKYGLIAYPPIPEKVMYYEKDGKAFGAMNEALKAIGYPLEEKGGTR